MLVFYVESRSCAKISKRELQYQFIGLSRFGWRFLGVCEGVKWDGELDLAV
jgi:hypothetical protein